MFQYAFPHLDRKIENWLNDLFSLQAVIGASAAHNFLVGYEENMQDGSISHVLKIQDSPKVNSKEKY